MSAALRASGPGVHAKRRSAGATSSWPLLSASDGSVPPLGSVSPHAQARRSACLGLERSPLPSGPPPSVRLRRRARSRKRSFGFMSRRTLQHHRPTATSSNRLAAVEGGPQGSQTVVVSLACSSLSTRRRRSSSTSCGTPPRSSLVSPPAAVPVSLSRTEHFPAVPATRAQSRASTTRARILAAARSPRTTHDCTFILTILRDQLLPLCNPFPPASNRRSWHRAWARRSWRRGKSARRRV